MTFHLGLSHMKKAETNKSLTQAHWIGANHSERSISLNTMTPEGQRKKKNAKKRQQKKHKKSLLEGGLELAKQHRSGFSALLDAGAMLPIPGAGPIRSAIKAVTGFDERSVARGGGTGGGALVQTMNAPVAFARNMRQPFFNIGKPNAKGEVPFHIQALVGSIAAVSGGGYSLNTPIPFTPGNPALFVNNYQKALTYGRWRPTYGAMHYTHYAPTSLQSAVFLTYMCNEDPGTCSSMATTSGALMCNEFAAMGSAYEDFSLNFVETGRWNPAVWYTCAASDAASTDDAICPGCVTWAVENGTTTAAIGYIFAECQGFFIDERPYYTGAGLITELNLSRKMDREAYEKCVEGVLAVLRKDLLRDAKATPLIPPHVSLREFAEPEVAPPPKPKKNFG